MNNYPDRPVEIDPLKERFRGFNRTPSQWKKEALKAEKEKRWGDAYYYWQAGATAYTRNNNKSNIFKQNALVCLKKWELQKIK
jgi:hypothetical protein